MLKRLHTKALPLQGLHLVERLEIGDERGFLSRIFCSDELARAGWSKPIAQINHTFTAKCGTVRGLHFQRPPGSEMKLVSCLSGEVWDVAVDIRADSETFLHWHAERLSPNNRRALLIPEGFAHGFQTLTDNVTMLYCHSERYMPEAEAGLHVDDPHLNIAWPLERIALSNRDAQHSFISGQFNGIQI